jgi:hypothetical protein
VNQQAWVDQNRPQPATRIVRSALALYGRYPLLFLALGSVVVVPFDVIVLAATGHGYLQGDRSGITPWLLQVGDWVWLTPLISALHIYAVAVIRLGNEPRLPTVGPAGFQALPRVVPATVVSGLLIGIFTIPPGLIPPEVSLLLFIGGLYLTLRFVVVAQVASMEKIRWLRPLPRSFELTEREWGHVLVFLVLAGLVVLPFGLAFTLALHSEPATPATFLGGLLIHIVTASFAALATALLYYDLVARKREARSADSLTTEAA